MVQFAARSLEKWCRESGGEFSEQDRSYKTLYSCQIDDVTVTRKSPKSNVMGQGGSPEAKVMKDGEVIASVDPTTAEIDHDTGTIEFSNIARVDRDGTVERRPDTFEEV
jgi:hypothetical protein